MPFLTHMLFKMVCLTTSIGGTLLKFMLVRNLHVRAFLHPCVYFKLASHINDSDAI